MVLLTLTLILVLHMSQSIASPLQAPRGTAPNPGTPQGQLPPAQGLTSLPLPRDKAPAAPFKRWVYLLHYSPSSVLGALEISKSSGECRFKAPAAAPGDAVPGLPHMAASAPCAGWSTVPPAYFGVDLGCPLAVPKVDKMLPAMGVCPRPSLLQPGTHS